MTEHEGKEEMKPAAKPRWEWKASLLGFIAFFALSGAVVSLRPTPIEQPIAFNHRKHVVENDMACSECHQFYQKESFSGLPTRETCEFCHEEPVGESAEERRLVDLLGGGGPLEWKPLFQQPPHVFYSHRRHVAVAKLECSVCHGSIGESEAPPSRVTRLTMETCIGCHREQGAATDCTSCHR